MFEYDINCTFSLPVRFDNTTPTLPTHAFYFRNQDCTVVDSRVSTSSGDVNNVVGFNPTTTISTTSDIQVYGYMSSGELLIAIFLMLLVFLKLYELLAQALNKVNTKRKYLGYNGGDVPIKEEI